MNMQQQANQPRIILASQSSQRRTMMDVMMLQCAGGIPYEVMPADIDELAITGETQFERAALVAQGKGREIVKRLQQSADQPFAVLAADTYLADENDRALEKPTSLEDAKEMLRFQSGKIITEYTGVYWYQSQPIGNATAESNSNSQEFSETYQTQVTFRELSDQEINTYVQNEPVLTFSGAFCPAYPAGAALIERINGSFTGFTHGFPIEFFIPKLQAFLP